MWKTTNDGSVGFNPRKETSNSKYFTGPKLLFKKEDVWPNYSEVTSVEDDGPEIKKNVNAVQLANDVPESTKKEPQICVNW